MPKIRIKVKAKRDTVSEVAKKSISTLDDHVLCLVEKAAEKGYLLFDEIIDYTIENEMSIAAVDDLSNSLKLRGILVFENAPKQVDEEEDINDYAQLDYDTVYSRIVDLDPYLKPFIEEVKTIKPAQNREISQLKYQLFEGNQYARERLIEIHLRTALRIALNQAEKYNLSISDLISASLEGVLVGVDKYNPYENGPLGSYISFWCFQCVNRALPTNRPLVYYPAHVKETIYAAINSIEKDTLISLKSEEYLDDAFEYLIENNYPPEKAKMIIESTIPVGCLDDVEEPIDPFYYLDFEQILDNIDRSILLNQLKKLISPKEYTVIYKRYGFDNDIIRTLEEVGDDFGVTRERARQIEKKALRKLRAKMENW